MAFQFLGDAVPTAKIMYQSKPVKNVPLQPNAHNDLVSCVMVTRGDVDILRHSVNCYRRQTYINKELVIITENVSDSLRKYWETELKGRPPVYIHGVPKGLRLGDLRNLAIGRSGGTYICVWDDDDLHHDRFVEYMMAYIRNNNVAAAFLDQLTVWWPGRRQFSISHRRVWEGSMVAHRAAIPIYPSMPSKEDTVIKNCIIKAGAYVEVSAPHLYTYVVTGKNTCSEDHFEIVTTGDGAMTARPERYDAIYSRLNAKYDVDSYKEYILAGRRDRESRHA